MISLRKLSRQRVPKEEVHKLIAEIRSMQDRAAAIVAATLVEDALEDLITSKMARLSKTEHERLFLGEAPLANFGAKILIARAFKLLDKDWARDITSIKDVRNAFAHARLSINFDTQEISDVINELRIFQEFKDVALLINGGDFTKVILNSPFDTTRDRFVTSCIFISNMLLYFPPDPDFFDDEDEA